MSELKDFFSRSLDEVNVHNSFKTFSKESLDSFNYNFALPEEARAKSIGSSLESMLELLRTIDFELYENMVRIS
jgi:hypothetical protein